jgi:hypothetical protein
MRGKNFFRIVLLITLLAAVSLSCQLVTEIRETIGLVNTGQAFVTKVEGFATEFIPPGMGETMQAVGPTIQAIAPTIQAVQPTMQAFMTEMPKPDGEAPPDIPLMEGERSAFMASSSNVSYMVDADQQAVVDFYKREMPNNGWRLVDSGAAQMPNSTELNFEKDNRKAKVLIMEMPFMGKTNVIITIEE